MVKNFGKRLITILLAVMLVVSLLPLNVFATTQNVLDGRVSVTDTANSNTVSNGVVTIKAKGSLFGGKTNNITITNETENKVKLSFSYSASTYNSFTIAGVSASASGTYSVVLEAGASLKMTLISNSGLSNTTATLTLSNFSLTVAADSSNVTVEYDSTLGSVTADGAAIASGVVKEGVTLTDGIALIATANSGTTFHGWIDAADNSIISTDISYTLKPAVDTTVKAVFTGANSAPHFGVGVTTSKSYKDGFLGTTANYHVIENYSYIFEDLNSAALAEVTKGKVMVLLNNSTLVAGTYTIPSGVTMLIPFDDANTLYTTSVVSTETYTQPTAYRTLTMADGAKIVINGAVSLSATQRCAQGSKTDGGSPTGAVSFVKMEGSSNITINNGGTLYAYGFITGSGSVVANNGAKVHENFQFMDFRGGSQTTEMKNKVFPLNQYYVQNIEVPLTLNYGATEYAFTTIKMQGSSFGSSVDFIGPSDAMFNLTSGSVTKYYDGSRDRLIVDVQGNISISPITMKIGLTDSLNSKDYVLPVNSNISITANSGSNLTIAQDVAFLPGTETVIAEGANCKLNDGIKFYIYDKDQWGGYSAPQNAKLIPVTYAPGKKYVRTEADLVDAKVQIDGYVDATLGNIYATAGGANVFSTGTGVVNIKAGTDTCTYQLTQAADVSNSVYNEIPLTAVELKNNDGSNLKSATDTYTYTDGFWRCSEEKHVYTDVVTAPTCTDGGYTTHTCDICKHSYKDGETAAKGHNYSEEIIIKPTCTEKGEAKYTCDVCGDSYTEPLAENGHDLDEKIIAPTCTQAGKVIYTCKNCDYSEEYTGEPAKGHDYKEVVTAPTCTEEGYTTYTCACGYNYVNNYVDALGHTMGDWIIDTEADCETAGSQHKECANCGYTETEVIPAKGHDYKAEVTAPTCTEQGYTTYTCSCGDSYVDNYVAALGHSWNAWETETESGCETAGSEKRTCSACGEVETRDVDAKGHSYSSVVTEPTCTEQGYTTYTCSSCGNSYVEDYVAALGHTMGDWIIDTDADCENAGSQHKECAKCDYTEKEEIPAKGHDYNAVVTAPTCTEEGYTTYTCACGDSYVDNYVDALGHNETAVVTEPTCTEQGYTTYTCGTCGNVRVDDYVDALGHDYKAEVTAPTCTEEGYTTYTCACGDSYVDNYVDALGHSMGDWIVDTDADCENPGSQHKECANCDYIETEEIPAKGHDYNAVVTEPTCTEEGYTTYTCACGDSYVADKVAALGHNETAVVTEPTCTEQGYTTYTCGTCGEVRTDDYVDALGHDYKAEVTAPTCTEEGFTTYTCACGDSYVDNYVAALGHNHGEWEIKIIATHSNEGMRVRKCACGDIETEVIPMIICDVDFDGFVNGSDLSVMKKYLINKITVTAEVEGLMDMNENGKVDILDLVKLKKYIAANTPVTK